MRRAVAHPARLVPLAFLIVIAAGTGMLLLPVARVGHGSTSFVTALFTATSATCVTGLTTVDTATYWTGFGHAVITVLTQLGGFGIVTAATLLTLVVSDRLGIRTRLLLQSEGRALGMANARQVVTRVAITMLAVEAVIALILAGRLWLGYDYGPGKALWYGVFHGVSAFNNAGFALYSNSLNGFVGDGWICLPITLGVIAGSVGFPVLFELARRIRRPNQWSTHTRLTVIGTAGLLAIGFVVMLGLEWNNPHTFGPLGVGQKLLAAFTQGSMPRSGGFSSVDYSGLHTETTAIVIALMFIGGGSASTAGGIKLTTFLILAFVIWAEIKGDSDVVIGRRRIAEPVQRQALTVALLGVALVAGGTLTLLGTSNGVGLQPLLFEVTSAFATVGLSTGITPALPIPAQLTLTVLMFVGRVGTIAVASALALTARHRLYRYPEERPIVG
jgi:trk system potassium uptake protein TrkH